MLKALVTGGAGFIGSHLCERLVKEGYEVFNLDIRSCYISGAESKSWPAGDAGFLNIKPDIIFHLGEYARVLSSFEDIESVVRNNIISTAKLLEYWRNQKCKLVYAGSSTKFGDAESPYSFTKSQNAELIKRYGQWFGLDYAITYFYNVYGEREKDTLINSFIEADVLKVNSPGTQKRTFTHVDDIVDGLLLVAQKGDGEYCLGSEEEYSVLEVAEMFGKPIEMQPEKRGDRSYSSIDLTRSKKLGWKAKRNLKDWIRLFAV